LINDSGNMQLLGTLTTHLHAIENDITNLKNDELYLTVLKDLLSNDLNAKIKTIKDETNNVAEPIKLWVDDAGNKNLEQVLGRNFQIFYNVSGQVGMKFPVELRDADDIEILPGTPQIIRKKAILTTASVVLGGGFSTGVNTWKVRIDQITGNQGWVGIGVIDKTELNFKGNCYSQAFCLCSDQSFYRVTVENKTVVATGGVFTIKVDFFKLEVELTSENGLMCKGSFNQGVTMYPFFELTHGHQLSVLSFSQGMK